MEALPCTREIGQGRIAARLTAELAGPGSAAGGRWRVSWCRMSLTWPTAQVS